MSLTTEIELVLAAALLSTVFTADAVGSSRPSMVAPESISISMFARSAHALGGH
jgi:hypothetical protein